MGTTTIEEIDAKLRELPPEQLSLVMRFIRLLAEKHENHDDIVWQGMIASQEALGREWNRPEEDEAWADL